MAIRYKLPDVESYARDVLTIAALSILFTAPVGAIGIAVGGPLLLSRDITVKDKQVTIYPNSNLAIIENQL